MTVAHVQLGILMFGSSYLITLGLRVCKATKQASPDLSALVHGPFVVHVMFDQILSSVLADLRVLAAPFYGSC